MIRFASFLTILLTSVILICSTSLADDKKKDSFFEDNFVSQGLFPDDKASNDTQEAGESDDSFAREYEKKVTEALENKLNESKKEKNALESKKQPEPTPEKELPKSDTFEKQASSPPIMKQNHEEKGELVQKHIENVLHQMKATGSLQKKIEDSLAPHMPKTSAKDTPKQDASPGKASFKKQLIPMLDGLNKKGAKQRQENLDPAETLDKLPLPQSSKEALRKELGIEKTTESMSQGEEQEGILPFSKNIFRKRKRDPNRPFLSLVVSAEPSDHMTESIKQLVHVYKSQNVQIGEVLIVVGKKMLNAVFSKQDPFITPDLMDVLKTFAGDEFPFPIRMVPKVPTRLRVESSPAWVVRHKNEDHVYEGNFDVTMLFTQYGDFIAQN